MKPLKRKQPDSREPAGKLPRWVVAVMWVGLLLVVFVVITDILPIGHGLSPRGIFQEKRLMATAKKMEDQNLWYAAAEIYEGMAQDSSASSKARGESAEHLFNLYTKDIPDLDKAHRALEKAVFFAKKPEKKQQLKKQLEDFAIDLAHEATLPLPASAGSTVLATVGGDTITMEELLYGWNKLHGKEPLTPDRLQKFTQEFMNTALLAEGARRKKLNASQGHTLDMRLFEKQVLSRDMLASVNPKTDKDAVKTYYETHTKDFLKPDAVQLQHILLRSKDDAEAVGARLAKGDAFDAVARGVSADRDNLTSGTEIGWVMVSDDFIPHVGMMPAFAGRMLKHDQGYTTGPIQTARGFHWFRLAGKRENEPEPFDTIEDQVEKKWKREANEAAQKSLLEDLKKEIPVTLHDDVLKQAIKSSKGAKSKDDKTSAVLPSADSNSAAPDPAGAESTQAAP